MSTTDQPTPAATDQPLNLDALKALDQAATPGPWQAYNANEGTSSPPAWAVCNDAYVNPLDHPEDAPAVDITVTYGTREDAELIAAARRALPALVAEVERLQKLRDAAVEWRAQFEKPARVSVVWPRRAALIAAIDAVTGEGR